MKESLIQKISKELDSEGRETYNDFADALDSGDEETVSAITEYVKSIKDPRKALLLNTAIREAKRSRDISALETERQQESGDILPRAKAYYRGLGSGLSLIPLETSEAYLRSKIQDRPYQDVVSQIGQEKEEAWQNFPTQYGVGKATGMAAELPIGGALVKGLKLAPKVTAGMSGWSKVGQQAANVGRMGALPTASAAMVLPEGEDSLEQRAKQAAVGFGLGGVVAPGIAKGFEKAQTIGAAVTRGIPTETTKTALREGTTLFKGDSAKMSQKALARGAVGYEQSLSNVGTQIGQVLDEATQAGKKVNLKPAVELIDNAISEFQKDVVGGGVDVASANNMTKKLINMRNQFLEKLASEGEPIEAATPKAAAWLKRNVEDTMKIFKDSATSDEKLLGRRLYGTISSQIKDVAPEIKAPYAQYESLVDPVQSLVKSTFGVTSAKDVAGLSSKEISNKVAKIALDSQVQDDVVRIFGADEAEKIINNAKKAYAALIYNKGGIPTEMKEYFRNRLMYALSGLIAGSAVGGALGGTTGAIGGGLLAATAGLSGPRSVRAYSKFVRDPMVKGAAGGKIYPYQSLAGYLGGRTLQSGEEQ